MGVASMHDLPQPFGSSCSASVLVMPPKGQKRISVKGGGPPAKVPKQAEAKEATEAEEAEAEEATGEEPDVKATEAKATEAEEEANAEEAEAKAPTAKATEAEEEAEAGEVEAKATEAEAKAPSTRRGKAAKAKAESSTRDRVKAQKFHQLMAAGSLSPAIKEEYEDADVQSQLASVNHIHCKCKSCAMSIIHVAITVLARVHHVHSFRSISPCLVSYALAEALDVALLASVTHI
jgi:hypothetical protein